MRNISKNISRLMLGVAIPLGTSAITLTSCNDFLDLKPLSEIVFENYWEDKADVESAVNSCYSGMLEDGFMKNLYIWGEMRSDNIVYSKSGDDINIQQIIEENILETNPNVKWAGFYQVINRCNTVIYYAPEVAEKDPNYTESDLRANIAEATWIRSLSYFYLARTFRDVPYVTTPSMTDDDIDGDYRIEPTPFKTLLRQLITDLEAVQGDAMRFYPPSNPGSKYYSSRRTGSVRASNRANTSRVTQIAFYSLIADIAMWLEDYQTVIDYTKRVIDFKANLYRETKDEYPSYVSGIRLAYDKYPLILEMLPGDTESGNAYREIFGIGNSFESVFEIYGQDQSKENAILNAFVQNVKTGAVLCNVYSGLYEDAFGTSNKYFKYTDSRMCENFEFPIPEGSMQIQTYRNDYVRYTPPTSSGSVPTVTVSSTYYPNWIIYRLTDIMLLRAEALIELGGEENLAEAFELISAVYNRANNLNEGSANGLNASNYPDQTSMRQLVREERHRELMFEGKRWYDLVRYALHDGNNESLISTVLPKQQKNANRIRIQLKSQDALFWPYSERELDMNPHLKQNPAYITNETSKK